MNCSFRECGGEYEERRVSQAFRHNGDIVVLDNIPAEVCDICGDTLLAQETVRHIEKVLLSRGTPARTVPLYEYA